VSSKPGEVAAELAGVLWLELADVELDDDEALLKNSRSM
jgi:hypothetical protein